MPDHLQVRKIIRVFLSISEYSDDAGMYLKKITLGAQSVGETNEEEFNGLVILTYWREFLKCLLNSLT